MIVDGPEVEGRAVAGEVAGVSRWMRSLACQGGEAREKGVHGESGVGVEVTEEDLLVEVRTASPGGSPLRAGPSGHDVAGNRARGELAGSFIAIPPVQ